MTDIVLFLFVKMRLLPGVVQAYNLSTLGG